ncbi:DNA polymerase I [Thraustotheca clavata]|uniref:DNA polymerase I n=1 Tax=Thraustotheca clavata TaxID=74557 RepID=A0A1W0A008_9STRA|nr:DNA polymerase I [Thraustotheca clavata]
MWRSIPQVSCHGRRFCSSIINDHVHLLSGLTEADESRPVTLVQDTQSAQRVLRILESLGPDHYHACDTEVAQIDVKMVGPVGNGNVTCLSIYSGPDVDFGNGPYVWVDNLDAAEGTLEYFRGFLESTKIKKIWHNYSFDRHVLMNPSTKINVQGLGGDTMHMARLWNTARFQKGGYSLEALSADLMHRRKKPMKEIFGVPKLKKDGSAGKELLLPLVEDLQRFPEFRERWIRYSAYDAECTWFLHKVLKHKLESTLWHHTTENGQSVRHTMYEFYQKYIVPFGECLTDIERKGMHVDRELLAQVELQALEDQKMLENSVLDWAKRYVPEAHRMNISSSAQKQQLLFAPYENPKKNIVLPAEKAFEVENTEQIIEPGKTKAKKKREILIKGLGIPPVALTAGGAPAATAEALRELAGKPHADPTQYGAAYNHFDNHEEGAAACTALKQMYDIASINTMLNNFILPLQDLADENGRVHCSLNLNTDTGRLSSRKPNLQNQAYRYRIRDAFTAPPGKLLIVADYSQLELRLLAHVTQCKGMIEAFKAGGDFHSRTAMGMYDYVQKAVEAGEVLLEWDSSQGKPPVPLLKDAFSKERKHAKILNFSIAYGKTPFGLAKDFNVSRSEAANTLERWYADRPEVKKWQEQAIQTARLFGYTRTLMGRYRMLPDAMSTNNSFAAKKAKSHAERAAINTPIQGAAADVVMQAMLNIHKNEHLRQLGFEMVCQIHDEIIMEGPQEHAKEACAVMVDLMENPFESSLSVRLEVDAKIDSSWYKAK